MNIESARHLKYHIRQAAAARSSAQFQAPAIGIGLTARTNDYRIAILLESAADRRAIEQSEVRKVLDTARSEVDIEVVGAAAVKAASAGSGGSPRGNRLRPGSSVGHVRGGDGSLGFFATRRRDRTCGFVSCNHVIAFADGGLDGDAVLSPPRIDGGDEGDCVALLDGAYPKLASPRSAGDCAFATLMEGIPFDPTFVDGGTLVAEGVVIEKQLDVTKAGRKTPSRAGVVTRIEVDNLPVYYGTIKTYFDDVIEIGSSSAASFARGGDSGALVYTTGTFQPVGLLFAVSEAGGPYNAGWTWAHPIARVTAALGVDILVS